VLGALVVDVEEELEEVVDVDEEADEVVLRLEVEGVVEDDVWELVGDGDEDEAELAEDDDCAIELVVVDVLTEAASIPAAATTTITTMTITAIAMRLIADLFFKLEFGSIELV
jgi:hypothetical protein